MGVIHQPGIVVPQRAPYGFTRNKSAYNGPDSSRVRDQLQLLQGLWKQYGAKEFMFRFCWIQKKPYKEGEETLVPEELQFWNKNLVPFLMNDIQADIEKKLGRRNIFLKPRQAGYTTYSILRRILIPCILNPGENGLLISRNSKTAGDCFGMLKRCLAHFAEVDPYDRSKNSFARELHRHMLHTIYSNRRELVFDALDIAIRCESAEDAEVGQGYTYTHVVADEVARWEHNPEETMANMKAAVPDEGTLDLVSTANGHGGYFFEECMRARDTGKGYREFVYHFHTWNWHKEYRDSVPVDQKTLTKDELLFIGGQEKLGITVDLYQISWRRKQKEAYRHEFDEKFPEDDLSCFLLTGSSYFDKEIVRYRFQELLVYTPKEQYKKLTIFKKERPHRQYIIGADVASGLEVGTGKMDWSAGEVLDEETGEQVAEYRAQLLPDEFAWNLAQLGNRYNDALIAVERNNDGGVVIMTLERACSYMNLYKHIDWPRLDRYRRKHPGKTTTLDEMQGQIRELPGFPTNNLTRPLALNRARFFLSESPELIYSRTLIEEMSTFILNQDKRGRPEAAAGCHDDTVMAYGIAQYVRSSRLGYLPPETRPQREKYGEIPAEWRADFDPNPGSE